MPALLGSPVDLARAFVRATTGLSVPETPGLDPPAPEAALAVRTAPVADPPADPDRRCDFCGGPLSGRQQRFCCDVHRSAWHTERRRTLTAQIREALTDVQRAVRRLQYLCDDMASGALAERRS